MRPTTVTDTDRDKLFDGYLTRFGVFPPAPACVSSAYWCEVVAQALADGVPVPPEFDWWAHVPPDAVA